MNKKQSLPRLVIFGIITLVTSIVWVGFEIYRAYTNQPDPVVPPEVIQKLDPTLDQIILEGLVQKLYLDDQEIGDTVLLSPTTQQTVVQTVQEVVTEIQEDQIASEEGQLQQ